MLHRRGVLTACITALALPLQASAQGEAGAQLECTEWVRTNVRYGGPPQPQGRIVGGTYTAASPLEHVAHVLALKRFRDDQEREFAACMNAKKEARAERTNSMRSNSVDQHPGCAKDTDCKGNRICEGGVCTDPAGRTGDLAASPTSGSLLKALPDLTGTWVGTVASSVAGSYTATIRFIQQGSELRGTYSSSIGGTGTVAGAAVDRDSRSGVRSRRGVEGEP